MDVDDNCSHLFILVCISSVVFLVSCTYNCWLFFLLSLKYRGIVLDPSQINQYVEQLDLLFREKPYTKMVLIAFDQGSADRVSYEVIKQLTVNYGGKCQKYYQEE